jgi:hypothetical protein
MKNTFTTINVVIGSVAFILVLEMLFWHLSGLYWYKGMGSGLYRDCFYLGLAFTLLAAPFAVWGVRGHWKSTRLLSQFIWCCSLAVSYFVLFIWCGEH